ncbi:hypothetical protein ACFQX6_59960 [Streptosporangium lutulentum]
MIFAARVCNVRAKSRTRGVGSAGDQTIAAGRSAAAGRLLAQGLAVLGAAAAAFLTVQFGFTPDEDLTPTTPAVSPSPSPVPTLSTGSALLDRIGETGRLRVAYRDGLPGISLGRPPRGFETERPRPEGC